MDLSGDSYSFGLVEWLVEHAGADRVLFGSDLFMIDGRTVMGRVLDAGISSEAKAMILGENAARIFGLT
jgi:predicted TIM-barrel fold metal-dependent hydrolase